MNRDVLKKVEFIIGDIDTVNGMANVRALPPFSDDMVDFLSLLSREILKNDSNKQFPDVMAFGFWIRKASLTQMKMNSCCPKKGLCFGRGVAFHIAPSNVPVNFAYSLAVGLLSGNANIVRVPTKEFPQIDIICEAINSALEGRPDIRQYISLIRYEKNKLINDELSSVADTRIIWGGDETIRDIRTSPLPPRSNEITFANRYSIAIIDSDEYLSISDKDRIAQDFYNDTYLSDQNACTSPRLVVWHGDSIDVAQNEFWERLHDIVKVKYKLWDIKSIDKLSYGFYIAAQNDDIRIIPHEDNLIVRMEAGIVSAELINNSENSGFFIEYKCDNPIDLFDVCNDKRCQTVGILGSIDWIKPLIGRGVKGIDRIAKIGHTMDFDVIWDGYDLINSLTRIIDV